MSEPRRYAIEMHASAFRAFGLVVTLTYDLCPLTLKIFSAILTHVVNMWASFIASREIDVNRRTTDGRTDGRTDDRKCLRRLLLAKTRKSNR